MSSIHGNYCIFFGGRDCDNLDWKKINKYQQYGPGECETVLDLTPFCS